MRLSILFLMGIITNGVYAQVQFFSKANPSLTINNLIVDNGIPNALSGQTKQALIITQNNGQGFDVYRFEKDGMPVLMPDATNRASLKNVFSDTQNIAREANGKLDLANLNQHCIVIKSGDNFKVIKANKSSLNVKNYKFKSFNLENLKP